MQLHEKYTWINDGVRGKKSIGSFQGTSTIVEKIVFKNNYSNLSVNVRSKPLLDVKYESQVYTII
jgi:hypothetical protein